MDEFTIAGASVPGMDHINPGQAGWTNNQDAFAWEHSPESLIAVVCDGCSSHPHSEVGAKIGASVVTHVAKELFDEGVLILLDGSETEARVSVFLEGLMRRVLLRLEAIAQMMGRNPHDALANFFLFATVGAVITPKVTIIFSCGDGVYAVNEEVTQIGPYPGNQPPYLAYNLLLARTGEHFDFVANDIRPTTEVQSLLIGTDGVVDLMHLAETPIPEVNKLVGPLSQFWQNDLFFKNADSLRRRLAIINRERVVDGRMKRGLLPDDTTLVVIRRKPEENGDGDA